MLLSGSLALFVKRTKFYPSLQLLGAASLTIVVLTHVREGLHLFPSMQWGSSHSAGHYLDFSCMVLGFTLFPLGYLLYALGERVKLTHPAENRTI